MDAIVAESWVTLDPRLLGKNVIVLSLKVANNLGKAVFALQPKYHNGAMLSGFALGWKIPCFVVNLITESRSVHDSEGDACAFLVEFQLCYDRRWHQ